MTGELLEHMSTWRALQQLDEVFILIPMLNNMKGNLEMNLSARLSTAANTGHLDDVRTRRLLMLGNVSALQVQALAMAFIAAIGTFTLGKLIPPLPADYSSPIVNSTVLLFHPPQEPRTWHAIPVAWSRAITKLPAGKTKSGLREFLAVLGIALSSASLASFILGSFMCGVILVCRRIHLDPDNITPPLASSLSDLLTLTLVGLLATFLTLPSLEIFRLPLVAILLAAITFSLFVFISLRNEFARPLIKSGWTPLIWAMTISSGTGLVLDKFVTRWEGFGALSVVIGGLPGSIGSVFVSRISTRLHANPLAGQEGRPWTDNEKANMWVTSSSLFFVGLPVLSSYLAFVLLAGWLKVPLSFVPIFMAGFCLNVTISLYLAHFLTHFLWGRGLDPDIYCMPVHSSLVDLSGQCLLVLAYWIASSSGADVQYKAIP
ncbi:hypothetical protein BS47DRAFT_1404739 [Hydnum rufescens UP504]|uniref:SLC41A/MgtE integral membrane domain-containing protein n=1 Tax=Hydnum rufescens UP504 TaxID=1448309 RepID=A0A9P6BBK2_9AGAM|nr:hypothetical protein BS47DRAFT_1404739 [Hydnum rufescens UP504]